MLYMFNVIVSIVAHTAIHNGTKHVAFTENLGTHTKVQQIRTYLMA